MAAKQCKNPFVHSIFTHIHRHLAQINGGCLKISSKDAQRLEEMAMSLKDRFKTLTDRLARSLVFYRKGLDLLESGQLPRFLGEVGVNKN